MRVSFGLIQCYAAQRQLADLVWLPICVGRKGDQEEKDPQSHSQVSGRIRSKTLGSTHQSQYFPLTAAPILIPQSSSYQMGDFYRQKV